MERNVYVCATFKYFTDKLLELLIDFSKIAEYEVNVKIHFHILKK